MSQKNVKHAPNNWIIILSALASNGSMTMKQLQQMLCLIRRGKFVPDDDRSTYSWYFSRSGRLYGKKGLDYGYMKRLPRDENGFVLYEITEKGHEYLRANREKPGYGCKW